MSVCINVHVKKLQQKEVLRQNGGILHWYEQRSAVMSNTKRVHRRTFIVNPRSFGDWPNFLAAFVFPREMSEIG